jgi:hypothetical protein
VPAWILIALVALLAAALAVAGSRLLVPVIVMAPSPSPGASAIQAQSPVPSPSQEPSTSMAGESWHVVEAMHVVRDGWETATRLNDGRVLIAGGHNSCLDDPAAVDAELFDPATERWLITGSMTNGRCDGHTATLLRSGAVLVAGGSVSVPGGVGRVSQASAELFDPSTGSWAGTGAMLKPRSGHVAFRLPDGSVVVVGGVLPDASTEVYDPTTGRWANAPVPTFADAANAMDSACLRTTIALADGRYLILCGSVYDTQRLEAAVFDPASGSTTAVSPPLRRFVRATLLSDGRVLVADIGPGALFDPSRGTWTSATLPTYAGTGTSEFRVTVDDEGSFYEADTVTALSDGRALITIGPAAFTYDPSARP